jgi:rSAM/selenodomain-associated transferase 2
MSNSPLKISTIIPVLNEYETIKPLVAHLLRCADEHSEIILVDGGSTDGTYNLLNQIEDIKVRKAEKSGRAVQMNLGAKHASGDIFYFLHADGWPPASYLSHIRKAAEQGHKLGCFQMVLTPVNNKLIRINTYFSGFKTGVSGGGDQSLFIDREVFKAAGGYNEQWVIMEDFELVKRLEPTYGYHHIPKKILVSARKYSKNSYMRVNVANLAAFSLFRLGASPGRIKRVYETLLR